MSLTFKLFSLGIRTLAKPIGNYIKRQAKEHDGFRRFAINQAQRVHRIDMRMRLGILHDPAAQERMHERERKAAEEKKKKDEVPTVRSEKEQKEHDQKKEREDKNERDGTKKKDDTKVKIRPLSDARAIELGANFFSEAFIFAVAVGLLLLENWRSRNKESNRRDEVADRFEALEAEVTRLKKEHSLPELEALNERFKKAREAREKYSWYNPAGWWTRVGSNDDDASKDEADAKTTKRQIEGSVPINDPDKAIRSQTPAGEGKEEANAKAPSPSPAAPERKQT